MSFIAKVRRGKGPFWSRVKRLAKAILHLHVPVAGPTRWLFRGLYLVSVVVREFGAWLRRFFWNEPVFRSQCATVGPGLFVERLPYIIGAGDIYLGAQVAIGGKIDIGFTNVHHARPEFVVGDDTFLGHGCVFNIAESIRIGKHCLIAGDVRMADYDGHPVDASRRRAKEAIPKTSIQPIVLEDDVWIGRSALILKGVTIGTRSIVGAGAVVVKDVPPDVVVAGNPACVVKCLNESPNGVLAPHRDLTGKAANS